MTEKNGLRKQVLQKRDLLSVTERHKYSKIIIDRLKETEQYKTADALLCYCSFRSEVVTKDYLEDFIFDGKKVYCPRISGGSMNFYRIYDLRDLQEGYMGIYEPVTEDMFVPADGRAAVVIMPGAVFDRQLNRCGYGGGYYDRFLQGCRELYSIALCFSLQLVDIIETKEHDIPADMIITERDIISRAETELHE